MGILSRIFGLKSKKSEQEQKLANLENQGEKTEDIKLDISVTNILLHSAKTNKDQK